MLYRASGKPNRAGARENFLFGTFSGEMRPFVSGAVVAERACLLVPNASPDETARIAASLHVTQSGPEKTVRFTAPDNKTHTLVFHTNGTALWNNARLTPQKTV